jgi:hypothetical protein
MWNCHNKSCLYNAYILIKIFYIYKKSRCQWLTSVILATQKAGKPYLENTQPKKGAGGLGSSSRVPALSSNLSPTKKGSSDREVERRVLVKMEVEAG